MGKDEFIEGLGKSLSGKVDESEYRSQIEYYSSYIAGEMASGRSEEDVLAELGDPRLIAKTIVQTYSLKDSPINRQFIKDDYEESSYTREQYGGNDGRKQGGNRFKHVFRTVTGIIIALIIIAFVTKALIVTVPFLILFLVIWMIIKFIFQFMN